MKVGLEDKGFVVCMAIVWWCIGVKCMKARWRRRGIEQDKERWGKMSYTRRMCGNIDQM